MKISAARFFAALAALTLASGATAAQKIFPHPDIIRYDSQCVTIDNKDTIIFSAAFHYFRCPKELWRDRFEKLKLANFNTVETYIPWNVSEPSMPGSLDDFSKVDLRDADEWMTMAESYGFNIIIRPGPYICAEWDRGGFPGWLISKRPAGILEGRWLRSDDPVYEAWSKHWLNAVCPMIAKHQITHKAPGAKGVILFQLENEYDYSGKNETVKANYVKMLAQTALAQGIDVPLFTCWTKCVRDSEDPVLSQIFDSCNFYTGYRIDEELNFQIPKLREEQPDAPLMTTELQGGWFTGISDVLPLRPDADIYRQDLSPDQIQNLTLLALQGGETITNYYMAFGGTNLGDRAAAGLATSYDYSAPIRECGGVGEKFMRVAAIGAMLREHGEQLARSALVDIQAQTSAKDVLVAERKTANGDRYIFIRTNQHDAPRKGTATLTEKGGAALSVDYELAPLGSKILYLAAGKTFASEGEWLPTAIPAIARPTDLPASVKIESAVTKTNPEPQSWQSLTAGQSLLDAGIYHSGFVDYKTSITLDEETVAHADEFILQIAHATDDHTVAFINGQRMAGNPGSLRDSYALGKLAKIGENEVRILYENVGSKNGGAEMEKKAGISEVKVVRYVKGDSISGWKMHLLNDDETPTGMTAVNFADDKWDAVNPDTGGWSQFNGTHTALYRTTVEVAAKDLAAGQRQLTFARMDDEGVVYVNGKKIGEGHDWSQAFTFDAGKVLHAGKNTIAIVIKNADGGGGIGPVNWELSNLPAVGKTGGLVYSDEVTRNGEAWSTAEMADASWSREALPEKVSEDVSATVTWHRLGFELPEKKPDIWVPWLIRLNSNGNGFVYLNGHALGRIWEAGKQRDFYLPECWLKFGAGEKNVVTLALRQVDKPVGIESAEVIPYNVYAEKR